jgi:acyl-coenzyme A thioesterase PaaI-like protein
MSVHPWLADMERLRARTREPGLADPTRLASSNGLAFLQDIVAGEIPDPPITHTLDFYLLEVESGRAVFQGMPGRAHHNPIASVHGGWHAPLLDSAMACAVAPAGARQRQGGRELSSETM